MCILCVWTHTHIWVDIHTYKEVSYCMYAGVDFVTQLHGDQMPGYALCLAQ